MRIGTPKFAWREVFLRCFALCAVCCLIAIRPATCQQQDLPTIITKQPKQIVNVRSIIQRDLSPNFPSDSTRFSISHIGQANGVWAATVSLSSDSTAVVVDQNNVPQAFTFPGRVRQLALGEDGRIHILQHGAASASAQIVSVIDLQGSIKDSYSLPLGRTHAFLSRSGVVWKVLGALASKGLFTPLLQANGVRDLNDQTLDQRVFVGALPWDGEYFTFGELSELVVAHRRGGSVFNSYAAPLDLAFRAIGIPFDKPAQNSGQSRIIWATSTKDGLLYICLSGTPMAGPAFIAVLDVTSGILQTVIRAELPNSNEAISGLNVQGTMMPAMGAIDSGLVIADQQGSLVAIY